MSTEAIKVLVVPGTMKPTRAEVLAADVVLKINPPSARATLLTGRKDVLVKRFPDTFVEG